MLLKYTNRVVISNNLIQGLIKRESSSVIRWISPSDHEEWLGIGVADRFSNARDAISSLKLLTANSIEHKGLTRCFVALPFSTDLWDQDKYWVLPRWILRKSSDNWKGIEMFPNENRNDELQSPEKNLRQYVEGEINGIHSANEHLQSINLELVNKIPAYEKWCNQVNQIKDYITDKYIEKAVLSRQEFWKTDKKIQSSIVFANMCQSGKDSIRFQFPTNSGKFLGVSPEILFSLHGRTIKVDSLAGTRGRSTIPAEDNLLSIELQNSKKDIAEHAVVTKAIQDRLKLLCKKVEQPTELAVKKFRSVQHLFRRVTGELHPGIRVDNILRALHPTPAIVGEPCSESYNVLSDLGEPERGLYSGPVGWIDEENAKFAVGIRSAIIEKNKFTLYAGAGIVKDSDPESEWEETNLKMQVMLNNIVGVPNDSSK